MFRTITLSLLILAAVGISLPYVNSAHGVRQGQMSHHHRYHSRAWWRRYRTRMRQKRAAALAHRNAMLGLPANLPAGEVASGTPTDTTIVANATSPADLKANLSTNAPLPGQMNLSVVALSRPNPAFLTSREASRMLAGVNVSDLRRIVIDKMVLSGGWVTNDFVGDINGTRVFVVAARTPRDARTPEKVWTFYFTEMGGRIYSLTTDSTLDSADRMATEAEHFITTLQSNSQSSNR